MQIRNTFLHFPEEEEAGQAARRASSVPPTPSRSLDNFAEEKQTLKGCGTPSTASPRSSVCSSAAEADSPRPTTLEALLARPQSGVTTLMVRNVPVRYTKALLLRALRDLGFAHCFTLFYLPMDFKSGSNLGYAFVDLVNAEEAARFRAVVEGMTLPLFCSTKVLTCDAARVQGLGANVGNFRNSVVMEAGVAPEYQPVILCPETEEEVPFPAPTRRLKSAKAQRKNALQQRLYKAVVTVVEKRVANMIVNQTMKSLGASPADQGMDQLVAAVEKRPEALAELVEQQMLSLRAAGKLA